MAGNSGGKGGGAKKYGRDKVKCGKYAARGKRSINKARKARKYAMRTGSDIVKRATMNAFGVYKTKPSPVPHSNRRDVCIVCLNRVPSSAIRGKVCVNCAVKLSTRGLKLSRMWAR